MNLTLHTIIDDDTSKRIQFREVFGLGLSYIFQNKVTFDRVVSFGWKQINGEIDRCNFRLGKMLELFERFFIISSVYFLCAYASVRIEYISIIKNVAAGKDKKK